MFEEKKKQSYEASYKYAHLDAAKIESFTRLRFALHFELFSHISRQEKTRVRS